MGRRRKREAPALPSTPVRLADALLYAEADIRRTIREERQALSLIGNTNPDGGGGRGRTYTDKTAEIAVKLADGLPCIVLEDGRTIRKPEKWIKIFDEVRKRAADCQRPEMIFETWRTHYGHESRFISAEITPQIWRDIKRWIRYHVLTEARAAGLVDFDDAEIMNDIEKAGLEWICES